MKLTFLFALVCVLSLPTVVGCSREPSDEERREAEFKAMPPHEEELGDVNDKLPLGTGRTEGAGKSAKKSGK